MAVLALLGVAAPRPVSAQMPPAPEVTNLDMGRELNISLQADNSSEDPGGYEGATFVDTTGSTGPWKSAIDRQYVGDGGAYAAGLTSQNTAFTTFGAHGEGEFAVDCGNGPNEAEGIGSGHSILSATFQVAADTPFELSGVLEVDSTDFSVISQAYVLMTGTAPDGSFVYINESITSQFSGEPLEFFHAQELKGNTPVSLEIQAAATVSTINTPTAAATASFEFTLDFGDKDRDGLLDHWETEGIDVDSDGVADIDLPAMDADPMHKNLYVEIDALTGAWQSGDQAAIDMVKNAFASAPAAMVDNPDGTQGVTLYVEVDDTSLPAGALTGLSDVQSLKEDWFGDPADHGTSYWDDLKEARLKVFRYCVWGDSLYENNLLPTGRGELPGNDFLVAAGRVRDLCSYAPVKALAGTFMHELGHNLGLHHGGVDDLPYKPNYLSVMTYVYQIPFVDTEPAWHLDYSRQALAPLWEKELDENIGLDGPATRNVVFNSAPTGQPSIRTMVAADQSPLDWNQDSNFEPDARQNISSVNHDPPDDEDQFLTSATDWDHLWYHLSGHDSFADGVVPDPASLPVEMTMSDIQTINSTEVVDLTGASSTGDLPLLEGTLRARPNPFNPQVDVGFKLQQPRTVDLAVYNLRGELVKVLVGSEGLEPGAHTFTWDGRDERGRQQPSGVYLVRLKAGARTAMTKVTLVK